MKPRPLSRLQTNFFAGLAVVLPAVISIAIVVWLFGTVSNITNTLLFAIPREWKFVNGQRGDVHWYWRWPSLWRLVGRLARYYLGRKLIETGDNILLRVPLLNEIYSTVKGNKSTFKEAVLVEFPQPGIYSLGFITSDQQSDFRLKHTSECGACSCPPRQTLPRVFCCSRRNRRWSGWKCPWPTPSRPSSASARSPRNMLKADKQRI